METTSLLWRGTAPPYFAITPRLDQVSAAHSSIILRTNPFFICSIIFE